MSARASRLRRFFVRTLAIARKEAMHISRDMGTLYFALGMPVVLLILFGFAVSFDIDRIRTAVFDEDRTPESRTLIAHMFAGETFKRVPASGTPDDIEALFRKRDVDAAVVIPKGYATHLATGQEAKVALLVDAADNNTASNVLSYTMRYVSWTNAFLVRESLGADPLLIEARTRALYNPELRSVVFLVPGLIAVIQMMMAVMLTALTVVRERERGTMEQLFATPVGRAEIIIGKLLPYYLVSIFQLLLILVTSTWVFGVHIRGSILLLAAVSSLFLAGTLSQGLLLSVVTDSQMAATQAASLTSMLPAMLLSGFIAPIENQPAVLQYFTNIVPARHFIHALRAILLRDAPFSAIAGDCALLFLFAATMLTLALRRFPRKVA